jgi:hypothetical protein
MTPLMWACLGVWLVGMVLGWAVVAGSERIERRRRRTLVDRLARDVRRAGHDGPDWPTVVEDAVLRQDMQWLLLADQHVEPLIRVIAPRGFE